MTIDTKLLDATLAALRPKLLDWSDRVNAKIEEYVATFPPEEQAQARMRALSMVGGELAASSSPQPLPEKL